MEKIKHENIGSLTFEEFRERFSTGEGILGQRIATREPIYLAPNETAISEGFKVLNRFRQGHANGTVDFYGIVCGVDLALSYIAAINPQTAVLTDINEAALDYLALRLDLFRRARDKDGYFDLLKIQNPKAIKRLLEYVSSLNEQDFRHLWFCDQKKDGQKKFELLKDMAEEGRIKAFQSDYYCRGKDVIASLVGQQMPDAAVFYLSDIRSVPTNTGKSDSPLKEKLKELGVPSLFIEHDVGRGTYAYKIVPSVSLTAHNI